MSNTILQDTDTITGLQPSNSTPLPVVVVNAAGLEIPVSATIEPAAGTATEAKQDTALTALGGLTETAPATDIASSGLNGRLQRIAQNITTVIARFTVAVAQTDALANPTTTLVGGLLTGYNGATWDRVRVGLSGVQTTFTGILNAIGMARYNVTPPTLLDGNIAPFQSDVNGNLRAREQYAPVAEDNTNGKIVVEQRYSYDWATADKQIKASAGFVHAISISPLTAAPTAGLLTIYDNTVESGSILYSEWVFATATGRVINLNKVAGTGIYVGFDGTLANVGVGVAYR